ncbi:MAG TPA: hypothetical protein VGM75_00230 [Pseudonocardiaceae bacterium]
MWLFSQVWFACLVGFAVGVGLTWLWQVRPLNRRVDDLERSARLADRPAQQPSRPAQDYRDDDFRPGFGNTTYSAVETTATPSGVGVSSGSGRPGLDELFQPDQRHDEPTHVEATRVHSVDDYVEALVQEYQGDAPVETRDWANRTPEAVESWRPGALGSRLDAAEEPSHPEPFDAQLTSYQPLQHYADPEPEQPAVAQEEATQLQPRPFANTYGAGDFGGRGNADEQYLEYLRSGADENEPAQPATPEPEAVRDYVAQEYDYPEYPRQQEDEPVAEETAYTEPEPEHPAEVTSVLPPVQDEPVEAEQFEAAQFEPEQFEPEQFEAERFEPVPAEQTMVNQQPVSEQEDEQGVPATHDYFAPVEPLTALVRPHSHDGGPIASAQPFQLDGPDRVDMNAQQGQLTPIEEGGWQPFAKPFEEEQAQAQQWQDDWSDEQAPANVDTVEDEPAEQTGPVAAEIIERADQRRPQVEPETAAESTSVFSPVTDEPRHQIAEDEAAEAQDDYSAENDYDYAPRANDSAQDHNAAQNGHLAQSEYGNYLGQGNESAQDDYSEQDYDEEAPASPSRSLFEPVIEPEQPTGYLTPVAPPAPQQEPAPLPQLQPRPTAPHPIRVRTGVAQPNRPVRAPAGSAGWQTGPFGPGSALPLPDGSAPSPQFRVKARTSSMVFHTESSPFYDRLEPQVWFTSQEDAQRAGFTSWERPRTW